MVRASALAEPDVGREGGWLTTIGAVAIALGAFALVHASFSGLSSGATGSETAAHTLVVTEHVRAAPLREENPGKRPMRLIVPRSAVVQAHGSSAVFVQDSNDRFVLTSVSRGEVFGRDRVIVSGVSPHDIVVTEGAEALRRELDRAMIDAKASR